MDQQLSFFRAPQPSVDNRSLFLAIVPNVDIAGTIYGLAESLRDTHHLRGALRPINHLHISLHGLGGWSERAIRVAEKSCAAAAGHVASFEVHLDRVMYWPSSRTLVLTEGTNRNVPLRKCRERLSMELAREIGLKNVNSSFTPHVTMLYGDQNIAPESVTPVQWVASEVVLICSHAGATKYEWLGRWPLLG